MIARPAPTESTRGPRTSRQAFLHWFPRLACAVLVIINVKTALRPAPHSRFLDLHIYRGAVRSMFAGADPYVFNIGNYPFTYPPFALLALTPTVLPLGLLEALWMLAGFAVAAYLAILVTTHLPEQFGLDRTTKFWVAAALLASVAVRAHLDFGQISLFVIVATFADAVGRRDRRWGGVAIGLCAAVKLTPLLFILWLLLVGRGRDAARALATFVACTALAWVSLPAESAYYWGTAIRQTSRVGDLTASVNQSLHGVLLRSGLAGRTELVVWLIGAAAVGGYALVRTRALHRGGHIAESAALAGCASLVVSPVTWAHHETWVLLAAVFLVTTGRRGALVAGLAVLVLGSVPLSDFADRVGGLHWLFDNSRALVAIALCLFAFRARDAPARAGA